MSGTTFALGLDFGTNSVRALIVNVATGDELATAVAAYPTGQDGVVLDPRDPNVARQHPGDYATALVKAVRAALAQARRRRGFDPARIIGIGVDTTGSTPLPVDDHCVPLALRPAFNNNLNAYAWLWKDHSSHAEAEEITALAAKLRPHYLAKCGGKYSSEWFWSKALHCIRVAPQVMKAAASWVELADYVPGMLVGLTDPADYKRSVCAAGHKAMYNAAWGGLPDAQMLGKLHPLLAQLRKNKLYDIAYTADQVVGPLCPAWSKKLGLPPSIPVAVGAFDAHMGAVGAGIKPGTLVKIIGTSTCDTMVHPADQLLADIPGLCGIVEGSILPGYIGLEAGQSAVGDIFNWHVGYLGPGGGGHDKLQRQAAQLPPGQSGLLALDWNHGNRTVLVDVRLTGLLLGQTLQTTPAEVHRALIEATAFGARIIMERFEQYGLKVREVINCGGIAEKSPLVMQIYADAMGRPMNISRSAQTCALGAAIFGAVAAGKRAGGYDSVHAAQRAMCGLKPTAFRPRPAARKVYDRLFLLYKQLHDAFGTAAWRGSMHNVMKDLLAIRDQVRTHPQA